MILVAGLVVWSGYTLMWWGRNRARGCETPFRELVVPGAYRGCTPGVTSIGYTSSSPPLTYGPPVTAPSGAQLPLGPVGPAGPGSRFT